MDYVVNFGRLAAPAAARGAGSKFRLAVLGDFSGGANAGRVDTGATLAARKALRVDVDNLDDVLARLAPTVSLALDGEDGRIAVPIASMDDFHPDQLAENVALFEQLLTLRRNLASKSGFDRAAKEVLSWSDAAPLPAAPREARGSRIATDRKLSDFARLLGRDARTTETDDDDDGADALIRRLVGPFVVPARDARQDALVGRVDAALTAAMRRVLHHPDFQAMEAVWRAVELLVRRIETGRTCEIVLFDISAEEFAADLAATDELTATGLHALLVEQPALDAQAGAFSAVIGLYGFEATPPHAELLGRAAQLAAVAGAPFLAGIAPDALRTPLDRQHPLIAESWAALCALAHSAYLGLATPRFLLRLPYGKRTDPIDAFAFEEFSREEGLGGMLWSHQAVLPALLLAQSWLREGAKMQPGSVLTVNDMPYFVYVDADGDQVALPCTERLYGERETAALAPWHVMPILSIRGRPEIRLGGFTSVAGSRLAGFWAPVAIAPGQAAAPAPQAAPEPALDLEETVLAEAPVTMADTEAEPEAPTETEAVAAPEDDLDALLASLNAPPEAPAADATDPDLDALLASLGA